MVLSSQMSRSGGGRSNMFARRTHKKRPWFLIIMVAALVVVAGWWVWQHYFNDTNTTANQTNIESTKVAAVDSNKTTPSTNNNQTNNSNSTMLPSGRNDRNSTPQNTPKKVTQQPKQEPNPHNTNSSITMGDLPSGTTPPKTTTNANTLPNTTTPEDTFGADPSPEVTRLMASAEAMLTRQQLVEARRLFNDALQNPGVGRAATDIRNKMGTINQSLIFSPMIADNDPFATRYVIQSGDRLVNLAKKAHVDWRFLARINNIEKPERIRIGQPIKIVNGPFHLVIDKSDYRMDVYIGDADSQGRRMFVRSFSVGLGEYNSTPVGSWIVRKNSKAINPAWTNPRTGEHFSRDNPKNPIGEFWVGLRGLDAETSAMSGYGIHGTIDPNSIGHQSSMGCIRMRNADIALVYDMLIPSESTVIIHGRS